MATDYKNTLNLPQTGFPMKADLVTREPERLQRWQEAGLYAKIQAVRAQAEKFVLHDGPPFANGDVHIGTALNKILKDIIIKYKTLRGFSAPYVPGWDCHGLPIEFKVSQEMRKAGDTSADAVTIRKACDAYSRKYIDLQRRSSNASAFLVTGKIRISPSTRNMRRTNCACLRTSSKRVLFIAVKSRFTGAFPAARRWPKPKWNTTTTSARAFT